MEMTHFQIIESFILNLKMRLIAGTILNKILIQLKVCDRNKMLAMT